jgi:hypothetical protein
MILEEVGWCGLNVHGEGEKPNQQVTLGEPRWTRGFGTLSELDS